MGKKILFIHYRVKERDGVSLEIEKRANILKKHNHTISYLAGFSGEKAPNIYLIPEIDLKAIFNRFLLEDIFYQKLCSHDLSIALYSQQEAKIYHKLKIMFERIQPELIFVHNLFSHCYNLPTTTALIKLLDVLEIPTVVVNHDFWFERKQFLKPKHEYIDQILKSLPPKRSYILHHEVINTLAARELLLNRRLTPKIMGDYFDFSAKPAQQDQFNQDLLTSLLIKPDDLIILHATRITPRKAIEIAFSFAKKLELELKQKAPLKLGFKTFRSHNRVVVVLPNFIEVDSLEYYRKLKNLAKSINLKVIFAWEKFAMTRQMLNQYKRYSLWDSYVYADLVTYTSLQEGFGNQFLEAIFFRKLPVLFEYPVFKADLAKKGYEYVSLGSKFFYQSGLCWLSDSVLTRAAIQTLNYLIKPSLIKKLTQHNFDIAAKFHDQKLLENELNSVLKQI